MQYKDLKNLYEEKEVICLINACSEETENVKVTQSHWDYYNSIRANSLTYLFSISGEYAIVLINEYDNYTIENCFNKDKTAMRTAAKQVAEQAATDSIISSFDVYYGEDTGCLECDELFVIIPIGTSIDTANAVANRVDELAYNLGKNQ